MSELEFHAALVQGVLVVAVLTALTLLFVSAPYGRHARRGWGPMMNTRLAWVVMESPSVLWFLAVFFAGSHAWSPAPLLLLLLWQSHYVQRTFVFPLKIRPGGETAVSVVVMGFVFNLINAYVNARWISELGSYELSWLADPRLWIGVGLFVLGYRINRWADAVLAGLRRPGETGYKIPRGGLYEWISCPNYFGELLEWTGWAIATWSVAGLSFALFTAANLVPRALTHHRWYREKFPEYPARRKAVIPFVL
jgi:3-oxo-5-alpha-steroid 4-dehydrogenase 1